MSRRLKAVDTWKAMKPPALRMLALAAFLMFSVLGLLSLLMESELRTLPWNFVIIQAIASGGLAASVILFGRRRWWMNMIVISVWSMVLLYNGGGFNLSFNDEGFRVHLQGRDLAEKKSNSMEPKTLTPAELDTLYTQRGIIGSGAIILLILGYVIFLRVIRREIEQRSRFETEVKIAQDIQQSLLPQSKVESSWFSISGITIPTAEVGGDYFDVIQLGEQRLAIVIADVTGHGVGAGILSSMTKSALYAQLQHDPNPVRVLKNLNTTLFQLTSEKMFVTFGYVLADRDTKTLSIATAGHPPILYRSEREKKVTPLRTINLGLGMQGKVEFQSLELPFNSGDSLLLYTDGLIEAMNKHDEQFGDIPLLNLFQKETRNPDVTITKILKTLRSFTKNDPLHDDVTIVNVLFI
jgi:serine phosphatase RsbU (regulator of sigma subunit)